MKFLYRFKLYDGSYPEAKGESWQEAAESIGLDPANIKRFMPVKWLDRPQMSEEIKEKLRQMKQEKKNEAQQIPAIDYTEAGPQYVIPTTPARTISQEPLRAKKIQKTTPLELETPAIEAQQGRLF